MMWPHQWFKEYLKARLRSFVLETTEHGFKKGWRNDDGSFSAKTRVATTSVLYRPKGIFLGDNVFVGHHVLLDGSGGLVIEEGCQLGSHVAIYTHSSHMSQRLLGRHYTELSEDEKTGFVKMPVRVGPYTGIGFGSGIRMGVTIGKGCMIHPYSFINHDVPDFAVVDRDGKIKGDSRDLDKMFTKNDDRLRRWVDEWQKDPSLESDVPSGF